MTIDPLKRRFDNVIRIVNFKASEDLDAGSHLCKKGKVYALESDTARRLVEEGKGEIVTEQSVRSTKSAEKRG